MKICKAKASVFLCLSFKKKIKVSVFFLCLVISASTCGDVIFLGHRLNDNRCMWIFPHDLMISF